MNDRWSHRAVLYRLWTVHKKLVVRQVWVSHRDGESDCQATGAAYAQCLRIPQMNAPECVFLKRLPCLLAFRGLLHLWKHIRWHSTGKAGQWLFVLHLQKECRNIHFADRALTALGEGATWTQWTTWQRNPGKICLPARGLDPFSTQREAENH